MGNKLEPHGAGATQVSPEEDIEEGRATPPPRWRCPQCAYENRFHEDGPCGNPRCDHVRREQDAHAADRDPGRVRGPRAAAASGETEQPEAVSPPSNFSGGGGGGSSAGVSNPAGPPSRTTDSSDRSPDAAAAGDDDGGGDDDDALIARAIAAANAAKKNQTPVVKIENMRGGGASVRTVIASCNRVRELITSSFDLADLRVLFAVVDTNGDGELSLVEFSAFVEGCIRNRLEDWDEAVDIKEADVEEVFNYIDRDNSGVIARRDMFIPCHLCACVSNEKAERRLLLSALLSIPGQIQRAHPCNLSPRLLPIFGCNPTSIWTHFQLLLL